MIYLCFMHPWKWTFKSISQIRFLLCLNAAIWFPITLRTKSKCLGWPPRPFPIWPLAPSYPNLVTTTPSSIRTAAKVSLLVLGYVMLCLSLQPLCLLTLNLDFALPLGLSRRGSLLSSWRCLSWPPLPPVVHITCLLPSQHWSDHTLWHSAYLFVYCLSPGRRKRICLTHLYILSIVQTPRLWISSVTH